MAVPILFRSEFWGFLGFSFEGREIPVRADETDVLRAAAYNLAASVIRWESEQEVLRSYEKLRNTFNDVIRTMGQIVGKKDPYTIEHQERVVLLATEIGAALGLDGERLEGLRIAGLVHDVGKVEIPSEILSKPGRLSPLEFELIKTHAGSSYDILREIDFPWPVAEIARQHHEKLDGSGYPRGLKGDEILLEARILTVADVVEAMASHRPYRPSLGLEAALGEIEKNSGILYDPVVVRACAAVLENSPGILGAS
jgi:putative nucleotidyltransferase with HDIG domain